MKKNTTSKNSSGRKDNFFQKTFGTKKKTVKEIRGGSHKEIRKHNYKVDKAADSGEEEQIFNVKNKKRFKQVGEAHEGRQFSKPLKGTHSKGNNTYRSRVPKAKPASEEMPLNKYLAHAGICSRREAVEYIKSGRVKVDNTFIEEPGFKVKSDAKVYVDNKPIKIVKDYIYILLNKPKGYVTTTRDPEGRKTVIDLVQSVGAKRLYPVGRLDRNTTGLLLITNDGDLAQKLSHPKYEVKKVYQAELDKTLTEGDLEKIRKGLVLEDGPVKVDAIAYLEDKKTIGIEIHSGKNRIVRRIFEHLGYDVLKLDRVMYAGLTKKNIPRGKFRLLQDKELVYLKHF